MGSRNVRGVGGGLWSRAQSWGMPAGGSRMCSLLWDKASGRHEQESAECGRMSSWERHSCCCSTHPAWGPGMGGLPAVRFGVTANQESKSWDSSFLMVYLHAPIRKTASVSIPEKDRAWRFLSSRHPETTCNSACDHEVLCYPRSCAPMEFFF